MEERERAAATEPRMLLLLARPVQKYNGAKIFAPEEGPDRAFMNGAIFCAAQPVKPLY